MPTVRPVTRVMLNPSAQAREKTEAMAPDPDRHSTPRPSSAPMTSVSTHRLLPASRKAPIHRLSKHPPSLPALCEVLSDRRCVMPASARAGYPQLSEPVMQHSCPRPMLAICCLCEGTYTVCRAHAAVLWCLSELIARSCQLPACRRCRPCDSYLCPAGWKLAQRFPSSPSLDIMGSTQRPGTHMLYLSAYWRSCDRACRWICGKHAA